MDTDDNKYKPRLFRRLRDARRAQGITQARLAGQAGCRQSALSMFESGRTDALARPTVEKIAGILGVKIAPDAEDALSEITTVPAVGRRQLCPGADCPSNIPIAVNGEVLFWPRRQPSGDGRHCAYCGEVLVDACRQCGAPLAEGACCQQCGTAQVPPPDVDAAEAERWAENRRRQIADWLALQD